MGKIKYNNIEDFKNSYIQKYGKLSYDWSKAIWIDYKTKIGLICHEKDENGQEHGEFFVSPNNLMSHNRGCPKCNGGITKSLSYYIEKSELIHKDDNEEPLYDYSLIKSVKNNSEKVPIICKNCGKVFYQDFSHHLIGCGCPYCIGRYKTTEELIEQFKIVQGDRYDYSKFTYINNQTKGCFICPKHGEFWQLPYHHLIGCGCPICNESKIEKKLSILFDLNKIKYTRYFKNKEIFGLLSIDFRINETKILIECQGKQHINIGGWGNKEFEKQLERDILKNKIAIDNNFKLFYLFSDKEFYNKALKEFFCLYNEENSFYNEEDLLKKLKTDYLLINH